jgi:hypothetical protein
MKFYEIDPALQEAIEAGDKPVRVGIAIDVTGNGDFENVFEQDILEAGFYGLREVTGETSVRGEVLLNNLRGMYSYTKAKPGTRVTVSFSLGEGLPWFEGFVFCLDDKGVQDIRGPGRRRVVRLGLGDGLSVADSDGSGDDCAYTFTGADIFYLRKTAQGFTVKTHRGLFNARIGSKVRITMRDEQLTGRVRAFYFRYRKNETFVSIIRILADC